MLNEIKLASLGVVRYAALKGLSKDDEVPEILHFEGYLYVNVTWICDLLKFTARGEARTRWRKDAEFAIPRGNVATAFVAAGTMVDKIGRAMMYGTSDYAGHTLLNVAEVLDEISDNENIPNRRYAERAQDFVSVSRSA